MTNRERIEAALNHIEPDRTPVFEYVLLSPLAEMILGRRHADYVGDPDGWLALAAEMGLEKAVRQYVTDRLDMATILGHDMLYVVPNPTETNTYSPLYQYGTDFPDDPVECVRQRMEKDILKPEALLDDNLLVFRLLTEEMRNRDLDLPVLAPAYFHGVWNDTNLMQTMILAPEVASQHFAVATRKSLAFVEGYVSLGIDQIGIGGDFAGSRPLISPEAYKEFIVPELKVLSQRIHESGGWAINASDGNLWPVLDDFLLKSGADGYLEIDMYAGMDLHRLKEAYGKRMTFYGNIDCGNVMSFGTVDDVRHHTARCIEDGLGGGGHIFCCSNAITSSVPLENYLALVSAYREIFGLPRFKASANQCEAR